MAILSTTQIYINGNALPNYNSCNLHQEIETHHRLDLECLLEDIQHFCKDNDQEVEELLGTIITIETKSYADISFHGALRFKGVITGLNYKNGLFSNQGDVIVIKAQSPTIIADDGPHHTSYSDTSFIDIIEDNFRSYDTSKLKINTKNSKLSEPLTYTVQYNESCFKFAQRLAARNGEWMYYNGEELVFGLDTNTEELELVLGRDLQNLNTSLIPTPQNFSYFTNDYLTDAVHEKESASTTKEKKGYFNSVNNSAKNLYLKQTKVWVNISDDVQSKSRLDTYVQLQQNAIQSNQIKITATSDNPGVMLATTIKISGNTYIVTKVSHSYSITGEYENTFEANSSNIAIYPKTDINAFPAAHSQTAKVVENNDPDGMGRVKVQFPWQKQDGLTTPWIRIITPHAGGDKGFHFIPEINEEVLVDFEGTNAEAPYVMGSLYHGSHKPEAWSTDKNDIKAIRTRSGHTIELNDAKGSESITITDNKNNRIFIDTANDNIEITANKNITISAGEQMTFNAKNIDFNVQEDMNLEIGKNKTESITENLNLTAKNSKEQIFKNKEISIGKNLNQVSGKLVMQTNDGKMLLDSKGKITIQSSENVDYGD